MRTKSIIIDAVKKLVESKDLQEISVQKICEEAGVSKGTFYAYFRDKYDVIHVFYRDFLMDNGILDSDHIMHFEEDKYYINSKKIISFIKDNRLMMQNLFKSDYQNSFLDFWERELNPKSYQSMLQRYGLTESKQTNYLIHGIMNGQIDILKRWLFEGCLLDEDDVFQLFIAMEKGLKLY